VTDNGCGGCRHHSSTTARLDGRSPHRCWSAFSHSHFPGRLARRDILSKRTLAWCSGSGRFVVRDDSTVVMRGVVIGARFPHHHSRIARTIVRRVCPSVSNNRFVPRRVAIILDRDHRIHKIWWKVVFLVHEIKSRSTGPGIKRLDRRPKKTGTRSPIGGTVLSGVVVVVNKSFSSATRLGGY
jgi:hypothetical protein